MRNTAATLAIMALMAGAQAFDFKGIAIGRAHSAEEVTNKIGGSCGDGHNGMTICNGQVTIAEVPATMNLVISRTGKVQRIRLNFSESNFNEVRDALREKFGKPASAVSGEVQNAFGAKYLNETYIWGGSVGTQLVATRYAGSRDDSSVYFSTIEDRKMLSDTRPKERAKDL